MPRLVRNWISGSYPTGAAPVGPPWQNTTSGGGPGGAGCPPRMPPPAGVRMVTGAKNWPGIRRPSTDATTDSATEAHSGVTASCGGALSRRHPPPAGSTARTTWASVGVVPSTTAVRPSGQTTPDRRTHGCTISVAAHPGASGPSPDGCSTTRASRPPDDRRATRDPSASSAKVCCPSTQSGSWNSAPGPTRATASAGRGPVPATHADGTRYGSHQPDRSSTKNSDPSAPQRGWPTETPGPPATVTAVPTTGGPSPPVRGARRRRDPSHGMSGWSQVTQASHRPSGPGRGAATKSPSDTTTTDGPRPSVAAATSR